MIENDKDFIQFTSDTPPQNVRISGDAKFSPRNEQLEILFHANLSSLEFFLCGDDFSETWLNGLTSYCPRSLHKMAIEGEGVNRYLPRKVYSMFMSENLCGYLKVLDFNGVFITAQQCLQLCKVLPNFKGLEELGFSVCDMFGPISPAISHSYKICDIVWGIDQMTHVPDLLRAFDCDKQVVGEKTRYYFHADFPSVDENTEWMKPLGKYILSKLEKLPLGTTSRQFLDRYCPANQVLPSCSYLIL